MTDPLPEAWITFKCGVVSWADAIPPNAMTAQSARATVKSNSLFRIVNA
jgi:hypothetical protein